MSLKFKEHFDIHRCGLDKNEVMDAIQSIFDKWLASQPMVYGISLEDNWNDEKCPSDELTARLVDIRPIEKRKEESKVTITRSQLLEACKAADGYDNFDVLCERLGL
jgi:hypothetical protein